MSSLASTVDTIETNTSHTSNETAQRHEPTTPKKKPTNNTIIEEGRDKANTSSTQDVNVFAKADFSPGRPRPAATWPAVPSTPPRGRMPMRWTPSFQSNLRNTITAAGERLLSRGSGSPSPSPAPDSRRRRNISPSPVRKLRHKISIGFAKSRTRQPSVTTSAAGSPDLKAVIKTDSVPDLDAVNQKLREVSTSSDSEEESTGVENMGLRSTALKEAHDCRTFLTEAMQARSNAKFEVCRAKCIEITHSSHADVETKIYAYNILSTQASVGQAASFLDESTKLLNAHVRQNPELLRLAGVIEVLKRVAKERDRGYGKTGRAVAKDRNGRVTQRGEDMGSEHMMKLETPKPQFSMNVDRNKVTPMTEQILEWALPGTHQKVRV